MANNSANVLYCSISGLLAVEPVVSKTNGRVYERRLVEQHIKVCGTDPSDPEQPLELEDLIPIPKDSTQFAAPPRNPELCSIPGILQLLQQEWDSCMLETFSLRQQLEETRQQLSHSLYQHDAACRVIANLLQERDEAVKALGEFSASARNETVAPEIVEQASEEESAMQVDSRDQNAEENSSKAIKDMSEYAGVVSSGRKKAWKQPPTSLALPEKIQNYKCVSQTSLHLASRPGINSLDVFTESLSGETFFLTGGEDGRINILQKSNEKVLFSSKKKDSHSKPVTAAVFIGDRVLSASEDGSVILWDGSPLHGYSSSQTISDHSDSVTCLAVHPSQKYFASFSLDGSICIYAVEGLTHLFTFSENESRRYTYGEFHPDGLYLGALSQESNVLSIWDVTKGSIVVSLEHETRIESLSFCENGYFAATADDKGVVKLWDLRKLKCLHETVIESGVSFLKFNDSGHYLAVVSDNHNIQLASVFSGKWQSIPSSLEGHSDRITALRFGKNCEFIVTVSKDRFLNLYE